MASVFGFFPGEPTCMRRPKRRRWWWIALVAASKAVRESRGQAAPPAHSEAQKLNVNSPWLVWSVRLKVPGRALMPCGGQGTCLTQDEVPW